MTLEFQIPLVRVFPLEIERYSCLSNRIRPPCLARRHLIFVLRPAPTLLASLPARECARAFVAAAGAAAFRVPRSPLPGSSATALARRRGRRQSVRLRP